MTGAPYAHEIDLRFGNPGREFSLLVVCPFASNYGCTGLIPEFIFSFKLGVLPKFIRIPQAHRQTAQGA
jgi:hypothetical protein